MRDSKRDFVVAVQNATPRIRRLKYWEIIADNLGEAGIPYGSKVIFDDGECVAVDTGTHVVNRKAARSLGRTTAERNAIVIDRFFDTKQRAVAWENAHPHFMMVRVQTVVTKEATN
jgi:hypothetical protein